MNNVVEFILNVIIGIVVPIFVAKKSSFVKKEQHLFYSYMGFYNKNIIKKLNISIYIDLIIIILFHIFFTVNCVVDILPFEKNSNTWLFVINTFIIILTLIVLKILSICSFKKNNKLNEFLNSKLSRIKSCNIVFRLLPIITIGIIFLIVVIIKIVNEDSFSIYIVLYYVMLVLLCIILILTCYVQNYVNLMSLLHVDSINIKLKDKDQLITKVLSYEKIGDRFIMILQDNGLCKSIETNYSNIEYIEKIIDEKETMLSMLQNEKDEKDKR